jgi:hypothetical protein
MNGLGSAIRGGLACVVCVCANLDQGFHYALRDGDSKLITDRTFEKRRLYDLARDRFEVEDRAAAEPTLVAALLGRLRAFAKGVAADPLRPR